MNESPRRLGGMDVAAVVVGAIFGVGIFFTPSKVAARAADGGFALMVWVLAGGVAALGALVFAELGGRMPESGGQFRVLRSAFGSVVAFAYAIVVGVLESSAAVAILAIIGASNVAVAAGAAPGDGSRDAFTAATLVVLAYVAAACGVRQGALLLRGSVAVKLLIAAAIILIGILAAPEREAPSFGFERAPSGGLLLAAFLPAFFAYGGWQQSLWIGGEVRDPGRNLPRGILIGVAVVVAAYVGLNAAYLRLLGPDGVAASQTVAADAVGVVFPSSGRIVAAAVAWSAFGCMQAILFAGPHQLAALARVGLAPRILAATNSRGAPARAAACFAVVALTLVFTTGRHGVGRLLDAVVCVDWIFFALTGAALFVLRRKEGAPTGYRVPAYPILPAVFVVAAAAIAASPFFSEDSRTPGFVALGCVVLAGLVGAIVVRRAAAVRNDEGSR